jgi:hypothetical protein
MKYLITITTNSKEYYSEGGFEHVLEINSNNPNIIQIFCNMTIQKILQIENICEEHKKQNIIDNNCNNCKVTINDERIIEYHDENENLITYYCKDIDDFYNHFINNYKHFNYCKSIRKYWEQILFNIYVIEIKNSEENDIKNKQDEQNDISNFLDRALFVFS